MLECPTCKVCICPLYGPLRRGSTAGYFIGIDALKVRPNTWRFGQLLQRGTNPARVTLDGNPQQDIDPKSNWRKFGHAIAMSLIRALSTSSNETQALIQTYSKFE